MEIQNFIGPMPTSKKQSYEASCAVIAWRQHLLSHILAGSPSRGGLRTPIKATSFSLLQIPNIIYPDICCSCFCCCACCYCRCSNPSIHLHCYLVQVSCAIIICFCFCVFYFCFLQALQAVHAGSAVDRIHFEFDVLIRQCALFHLPFGLAPEYCMCAIVKKHNRTNTKTHACATPSSSYTPTICYVLRVR